MQKTSICYVDQFFTNMFEGTEKKAILKEWFRRAKFNFVESTSNVINAKKSNFIDILLPPSYTSLRFLTLKTAGVNNPFPQTDALRVTPCYVFVCQPLTRCLASLLLPLPSSHVQITHFLKCVFFLPPPDDFCVACVQYEYFIAIFSFCHNVFKSRLLQGLQNLQVGKC